MSQNERCSVCIRECPLGQSFCQRRDDRGRLKYPNVFSAIYADHLFDKPIVYLTKNIKVLSLGSWGCNLRCLGCQNAGLSWTTTGEGLGARELDAKAIVGLAARSGCQGLCYTYNEPAILLEAIVDIARAAKQAGLLNIYITNSTLTGVSVQQLAPFIDAVAADIKSLEDGFYHLYCGAEGISDVAQKILSCIRLFHEAGCHVEVRTNVIPSANDKDENFRGIADWIRTYLGEKTPWHITRFFPAHRLSHVPATSTQTMLKAQAIGLKAGLKHVHAHFNKGCDCANEASLIKADENHLSAKSCCE